MLCFILFLTSTFAFDCLNEIGRPVDSWVILKKPQGTTYFYYDTLEKDFKTSPYSLNESSNGALAKTVQQLWQEDINKDNSYVIYNDQVPNKEQITFSSQADLNGAVFGHTKGLFAFSEKDKGFWLTHSIPLWPIGPTDSPDYLGLGKNAWTYAQHLFCISLTAPMINDLSATLQLNRPQIYDSQLSKANEQKYVYIKELIEGKYSKEPECVVRPFTSQAGGLSFKVYAKTGAWNNDLYAGCVTPEQDDTLWVESWIRGSAEGPFCPLSKHDTLDIKSLDFALGEGSAWRESQDHSKWAITKNKHMVCMGDINRMTTQYSRGGGTTCFEDPKLHSILKQATTETNQCFP